MNTEISVNMVREYHPGLNEYRCADGEIRRYQWRIDIHRPGKKPETRHIRGNTFADDVAPMLRRFRGAIVNVAGKRIDLGRVR